MIHWRIDTYIHTVTHCNRDYSTPATDIDARMIIAIDARMII